MTTDVRSNGHDVRAREPQPTILTDGEQNAAVVIIALVIALWLSGWVLSFANVSRAVEPYVGGFAPVVPLGVDIGIAAFTGLDLLMARMNMRTRWLRLVPWSLVGVTVFLNVADETDWLGRVTHAVLPLLSVVVVEAGAHVIKHRAGLEHRGTDRERLGLSLWLLAPLSTAALFRRTIITRAATDQYVDSRIVRARWRDEYGRRWRWRVPREQRVLYRLSKLKPADVVTLVAARAVEVPAAAPDPKPEPRRLGSGARNPSPRRSPVPDVDVSDLLPVARQIVERRGGVPSWKDLAADLRAAGHSCGTNKARALQVALKADQNGTSDGQA